MTPKFVSNPAAPTPSTTPEFVINRLPNQQSKSSIKRPNRIAGIERAGIWVETERSRKRRADPQLVPAWMVTAAWDHLCRNRVLTQDQLLNQLNVKRSAFVIALLALFPDVVVLDTRPTTLELAGD